MKKYQFKADKLYYGVVYCFGEAVVMHTVNEGEAILHYEDEIDEVVALLLANNIYADPIEVK